MSISEETVKKVAKLASLELSNEELERMQRQIGEILDYVDQLSKLNTEGVRATSHVHGAINAFRDDVVKESLTLDKVKSIAPDYRPGGFRVPRIIS